MPQFPRASRAPRRVLIVATGAALLATAVTRNGFAYDEDEEQAPTPPPSPTAPSSFAGMFGAPSFVAAAKSPDPKVRAATMTRAAEVAASMGPGPARDEMWRVVEGGTLDAYGDDPDASLGVRIAAARALASDTRKDAVSARKSLDALLRSPTPPMKIATPPPWNSGGFGPPPVPPWGGPATGPWVPFPPAVPSKPPKTASAALVRAARDAAAMSLGALGDWDALLARAKSRDDLDAHRAALGALIAFPPPSLSPLFGKELAKAEPVARDIVEVLAKLGDLRGADLLLRAATDGKDDVSVAIAIVALGQLGDGRVAAVARAIGADAHPELRVAAAEALAELGEPGADAAIAALLADDKTAAEGKRIAIRHPAAALVGPLEKLAREGSVPAVAALGRIGAAGIAALVALAKDDASPVCDSAAHQLAISPLSAAEDGLTSILSGSPIARRRIVHAAAVRAARVGSVPSGAKSAAKELAASGEPADRSAGYLLLVVLDLGDAAASLASDDLARKRAAGTALRAHPRLAAALVARKHLVAHPNDDPELVRVLAGVAARAIDGSVARDVPLTTATLATWLAEDGNAAPLAAYILAARGGDGALPHVTRALAASSVAVRVAALLGLGASPDRHATGELSTRLREYAPVVVRRAAARALVARGDPAGKSALDEAKRLDPDAEVRAIAATGSPSATIAPSAPLLSGNEVVLTRVLVPKGTTVVATAMGIDGLALPVSVDPGGYLHVFRAPPGPVVVDVAPVVTPVAPGPPLAAPAASAKPAKP